MVNVQNGNIFWGGGSCISNIFSGMSDVPDIFGVNSRCWFHAYV